MLVFPQRDALPRHENQAQVLAQVVQLNHPSPPDQLDTKGLVASKKKTPISRGVHCAVQIDEQLLTVGQSVTDRTACTSWLESMRGR
ncbi:hypothetical protein PF008_g17943 [Phytophthora fragariae]|uniref:Uncharacterized protein n=1 Tax=Phytophthora fragariae TaxID=53985 RepID=A0A6G0R7W8_9STRA|nr:hypothetical protein PF008_g17943 [Phytophthora fragariae]